MEKLCQTVEVVLVHCNLVNNNYQQVSKVLFTFVPNKQLMQNFYSLKYGSQIKIIDH